MFVSILIILVVILDQLSKLLAVKYVYGNGNITFIPKTLSFEYLENPGAAWGILSDHRWVFMTVSILAILMILGFFVYAHIKKEKISTLLAVGLSFFCGGGIGNMIDRIVHGYVIDFLKFDFIDFPIFNVADSFICIGAVLTFVFLAVDTYSEYMAKKKNGNS